MLAYACISLGLAAPSVGAAAGAGKVLIFTLAGLLGSIGLIFFCCAIGYSLLLVYRSARNGERDVGDWMIPGLVFAAFACLTPMLFMSLRADVHREIKLACKTGFFTFLAASLCIYLWRIMKTFRNG
jgi:hypothetical protein